MLLCVLEAGWTKIDMLKTIRMIHVSGMPKWQSMIISWVIRSMRLLKKKHQLFIWKIQIFINSYFY